MVPQNIPLPLRKLLEMTYSSVLQGNDCNCEEHHFEEDEEAQRAVQIEGQRDQHHVDDCDYRTFREDFPARLKHPVDAERFVPELRIDGCRPENDEAHSNDNRGERITG